MSDITIGEEIAERTSEIALNIFTAQGVLSAAKTALTADKTSLDEMLKSITDRSVNMRIEMQKQFALISDEEGRSLVKKISDQQEFLKRNEITVEKLAQNFRKVGADLQTYVISRSDQTIMSFAKLVSINDKFGISAENTMGIINRLGGGFGMNNDQIDLFSRKLFAFARETGQEFNKVFTEFNTNIGKFFTILDPSKATTQFMHFQQLAKGFGTTIDSLMQTAAKFDDIQQAVDFGANLNNVLSAVGGSFDAVMASTMDYDSRIKYIMKSIADTRGNIDQMSEVSQRAFIRQLQQSSGLQEQTLVSLLRNKDLVNNIENLTTGIGGLEDLKEIEKSEQQRVTENFTTFQERANLFLNVWTQFGTRAEKLFDVQTKFLSNIQFALLKPLSEASQNARSAADVQAIFAEKIGKGMQYVKDQITNDKFDEGLEAEIRIQQNRFRAALDQGFGAPQSAVIPAINFRANKGTTIELGEGLKVRHVEALEKLASEMESKRTNPPQEYKTSITVYGDETLLAVVKEFSQGGARIRQPVIPGVAPAGRP